MPGLYYEKTLMGLFRTSHVTQYALRLSGILKAYTWHIPCILGNVTGTEQTHKGFFTVYPWHMTQMVIWLAYALNIPGIFRVYDIDHVLYIPGI